MALSHRLSSLWKEILIVFIIKILVLLVIWKLCFTNPTDKLLTPADVQQHWFQS